MYLKHLLTTAAAAASLPAASAEFNPDADLLEVGTGTGAEHGATTLSMAPPVTEPVDGKGRTPAPSVTGGDDPPTGGALANTTTSETLPGFYQELLFVGPTWTATKYYDAKEGGLVNVAEGSLITLEIEDDGRFDGHAGCNNYFGRLGPSSVAQTRSASYSESSLVIDGPVGSTMMMCIKEATMVQEAAYLANFEGTINFSVLQDGSLLRLKEEGSGNVVAEYTPFTPRIFDHTWTATKYYSSKEDGLVDVIPGSVVTLKMEADEKLSGHAGCNNYFGAYDDLTSSSFSIAGPVDFTKMYCGQQDGIMDQERSYLHNFDGAHMEWIISDGGTLVLKDSDSGAVVALYDTDSEVAIDPPSASGGMAIKTTSADSDSGAVVALYDTDSEVAIDPLLASGGMAIKTTSAAVAMVAAVAFI